MKTKIKNMTKHYKQHKNH